MTHTGIQVIIFLALIPFLGAGCKTTEGNNSQTKDAFVEGSWNIQLAGEKCEDKVQRENFSEELIAHSVVCFPEGFEDRVCRFAWYHSTGAEMDISEHDESDNGSLVYRLFTKSKYWTRYSSAETTAQRWMNDYCMNEYEKGEKTGFVMYPNRIVLSGETCFFRDLVKSGKVVSTRVHCYTPKEKQCNFEWNARTVLAGKATFDIKVYDMATDRTVKIDGDYDKNDSWVTLNDRSRTAQAWMNKYCHD